MDMSKKELQILSRFRQDARENLTTASRKLNIPVSTIYERLKKYKGTLIEKHTALLDFSKLGYSLKVMMTFKVERENRDVLQKFLKNNHRVNSMYRVSNNSDFLIEVLFKDLLELQEFKETIESYNIYDNHEFYVVEDIKRESFLTNDSAVEILADN